MSDPGLAIRPDLLESQRRVLQAIARPGTWLDGAQRTAVAAASRAAPGCALCRERKAAVSPEHARGAHERGERERGLPEAWVDVAHRIRSDPGRLSRGFYERALAAGLTPGVYVEIAGLVALVAGLDAFRRALGAPPHALLEPSPGEPTRRAPEKLHEGLAWVPVLRPEDAAGPEADLYPGREPVPHIVLSLSSVPGHLRSLADVMSSHYLSRAQMADPGAGRALDRMQIELVAARVSALNECFY